jgi:anti-sigma-K factor RskA
VKEALQRLEKDAISREIYDTQYAALDELVRRLDKDKMDEKEFNTFVATQRTKDEEAANERRAVAAGLARSTETVAQTLATREERREGQREGQSATWRQIVTAIGVAATLMTIILGFVVLASNGVIG